MYRWNVEALALVIAMAVCCPLRSQETDANQENPTIISSACATPLQPKPSAEPVIAKTMARGIELGINPTLIPAIAKSYALPTPPTLVEAIVLPGLNTQSTVLPGEAMPSAGAVSAPDLEFQHNLLAPLSPEMPKKPVPHVALELTTPKLTPSAKPLDEAVATTQQAALSLADNHEQAITAEPAYESGAVINFSDSEITTAVLPTLPEANNQQPITGGLYIHPPMIQPFNRNQHTFVVENRSDSTAKDVTLEFTTSEDCRIIATLPSNSVFSLNKAVFQFETLLAGEQVPVHINAVAPDGRTVDFTASLIAKNVFEFNTRKAPEPIREANASTVENYEPTMQIQQVQQDEGAVVVRNPFVDKRSRQPLYR